MSALWVVEMLAELPRQKAKWAPTIGAGINREQARLVLADWRQRNRDDKFRLRKYVRVDPPIAKGGEE